MADRIAVFVYARDPVSQTGISSQLRGRPEVRVLDEGELDSAEVAVVATEEVDPETTRVIKAMQRNGSPRVVVVVTKPTDDDLLGAIEAGACALLRRSEATPEALSKAVCAAASGDGAVPPDLLGRLLSQVGRLQRQVLAPRGLRFTGFTDREIAVLKLVANGFDTAEIARELSYSERTIKNVIRDITVRLNLKNRTHAVAYAVREGLI